MIVSYVAGSPPTYADWASTHGLSGTAGDGSDTDPAFGADPNKDSVANGLVWLIGGPTGDPLANSNSILPVPNEDGGKLVMTFQSLNATARGTAGLYVQYSNDLGVGDAWHDVAVPDTSQTDSGSGVEFIVTPTDPVSDYNQVTAKIPASAALPDGKLFGRVQAVEGE